MSRSPDFTSLDFEAIALPRSTHADWESVALKASHGEDRTWLTPEKIKVAPLYSAADLAGVEHLRFQPGLAPFVRGPYATMYVQDRKSVV